MAKVFVGTLVPIALVLMLSLPPGGAQATTFNIPDGDVAGLIAAINTANTNPGADNINLAPGGTYTLTAVDNTNYYTGPTGLPAITSQITINGNGATIQRSSATGTPDLRIFLVYGDLTLNEVTVRGGRAASGASGYPGGGGGLRIDTGKLLLVKSTVTDNWGNEGGGIFNFVGGTLTVINSTVSHNTGYGGRTGGGILNMSTGGYFSTTTIINSTIFENRADGPPGFQGRGDAIADAFSAPGSIIIKNSILASPTQGLGGDFNLAAGVLTSLGHNIVGDASGGLAGPGDLNSTNPLLGILANHGGPTLTHAPLVGSPAINAVPLADCTDASGNPIATDQRGIARPQGAACDRGSVEVNRLRFQVTGIITTKTDPSNLFPGLFDVGSSYTAVVSYDPTLAAPDSHPSPEQGNYGFPSGGLEITFAGSGHSFAANAPFGNIEVFTGSGGDTLRYFTQGSSSNLPTYDGGSLPGSPTRFNLNLFFAIFAPSPSAILTQALPHTAPVLASFPFRGFEVTALASDFPPVYKYQFLASVTSVTPILNQPPVANAGPDLTMEATSPAGASVTLNGAGSSDPDGDVVTYNWTGLFGTVSGVSPTVNLPLGTHTLTLTVSDGQATATDIVSITVQDTTPPQTTLTSAVDGNGAAVVSGGTTLSNAITFTFGGTDAVGVAGFQCSRDGAAYASCTSPVSYSALTIGSHTFEVRALDAAGNVDASPASFTWTVVTPAQAIQNLLNTIGNMGLPGGVANSLSAPLGQASTLLNDNNPSNDIAACGKLDAFINQVNAKVQNGQLTSAQASQLLHAANGIKASLGC